MRRKSAISSLEDIIRSRNRPSSFPFITGDGFRAAADLVCDETGLSGSWTPRGTVFCAPNHVHTLLDAVQTDQNSQLTRNMVLVIHNGDKVPTRETFIRLLSLFNKVWSVNVTPELSELGIQPIPIGLENLHWQRNGVPTFFDLPHLRQNQVPASRRPNLILGSFRVETNARIRVPLRDEIRASSATWLEPTTELANYFAVVRSSAFVISPPGNGLDCHRTWEAIYLGAIPIVLRDSLPSELVAGLPIHVVASWAEVLDHDQSDLRRIAESYESQRINGALLPYWFSLFDRHSP